MAQSRRSGSRERQVLGQGVTSDLWLRCWVVVLRYAGSMVGHPGWRSPSSSGSWWWGGWWRPCPAGWWWRLAVAASWPTRRTQSSPFLCASGPHHVTSPSSKPATWQTVAQITGCNQKQKILIKMQLKPSPCLECFANMKSLLPGNNSFFFVQCSP